MNVTLHRADAGFNQIAVLEYEARRARDVAIVAGHGYSSSKQNLDMLCSFLAGHGFTIYSLDFPGHKLGASGGRLDDPADLTAAVASAVAYGRERYSATTYAVGHSMGATTALRACADDRAIAGAISIAGGYGRLSALQALGIKGVVDLRAAYVDGLTLPELVELSAPLLEAALPKLAGRPVLYIAGDCDAMVSRASVEALFERAPEPKTLAVIASDHTSAGENSRATILSWLNERHPR